MKNAAYWIKRLRLSPHPEGGYYREIYRAPESVPRRGLPPRYGGSRPFGTSIYFLLESGQVSRLHRLKSDEVWHFYAGSPVLIHMLSDSGRCRSIKLGRNPEKGRVFQAVIRAGTWFGAEPVGLRTYALVGCTVSPGFDFDDFEAGCAEKLRKKFPRWASLIERLTIS
jgi:predicted cupin superfamily sugar epimerase